VCNRQSRAPVSSGAPIIPTPADSELRHASARKDTVKLYFRDFATKCYVIHAVWSVYRKKIEMVVLCTVSLPSQPLRIWWHQLSLIHGPTVHLTASLSICANSATRSTQKQIAMVYVTGCP